MFLLPFISFQFGKGCQIYDPKVREVIALTKIYTKHGFPLTSSNEICMNKHSKTNTCLTSMLSWKYFKPKTTNPILKKITFIKWNRLQVGNGCKNLEC
jgi:hypothetical protein